MSGTRILRRTAVRAGSILLAVILEAGLWIGTTRIGSVRLEYSVGGETAAVGIGSVIIATMAVGLLAAGLLAVLERLTRLSSAIWTVVAVIVTAVSLASPIMMAHNGPAMATLVSMHVVAAVVVITGFIGSAPKRGPRSRSGRETAPLADIGLRSNGPAAR